MQTDGRYGTVLRIYWADADRDYSQNDSVVNRVSGQLNIYNSFLTNLLWVDRLRIDPIEYAGSATIRGIRITQPWLAPIELAPADMMRSLKPVQQIENPRLTSEGFTFDTTGSDPQFELTLKAEPGESFLPGYLLTLVLILLASSLIGRALGGLTVNLRWVPVGLLLVFIVVVAMATLSRFDTNPDEMVHWRAVLYYNQHWLPPALDAPEIAQSYSIYGFSRLANYELFYQFAGYASRLLQDVKIPFYLKVRAFNCLLLLLLVIFAARNRDFRIVVLPLLLTAQAWYLFGYINSDAFGLFVGFLVAYQAVSRQSMLNRFLREESPPYYLPSLVIIGLLLGLLLVVKANFYFFALLVGLYFIWRLFQGEFENRRRFWIRASLLGCVALIPYGSRMAMDMHANGFSPAQRAELRLAMNEKYAREEFKPSTPLAEKHIYLNLKERGFSIKRMLHRELWHTKMHANALASFGYTQFFAQPEFYAACTAVGLLLLGVLLMSILVRGPPARTRSHAYPSPFDCRRESMRHSQA